MITFERHTDQQTDKHGYFGFFRPVDREKDWCIFVTVDGVFQYCPMNRGAPGNMETWAPMGVHPDSIPHGPPDRLPADNPEITHVPCGKRIEDCTCEDTGITVVRT